MDYQSMGVRQLQQACRDRGLPTARDKETLIARLEEADATEPYAGGGILQPGLVETTSTTDQPEPVLPAVHRETFPARDGGPDDDEHAACRTATIAAAHARGYTTMGDAYRFGTVDGQHIYEVHLRRGLV